MTQTRKIMHALTLASLYVIVTSVFTSLSVSALHHILIIVPSFYFAYEALKNKTWNLDLSWWALGALLDISILAILSNTDIIANPMAQIFRTKYFFITLLMIFPIRALIKESLTDKHIKIMLWLFLISTSIATLSGLIGLYSGFNPLKMKTACHPERACGLYGMYMTYGYGISLFMIINSGLWLYRKEIEKWLPSWLITSSLVINFIGLFLSYARGAWIGFVLALPFFFFKKHKKVFSITLFSGLFMAILAVIFVPSVNRMFTDRAESNNQRIKFWKTAVKAFEEKPLLGWGYKNFEPNMKALKIKYAIGDEYLAGHAHNNFFEHLASTGALGFIALALFSFLWLKESYQREDLIARLSFPFVLSFFVSGMVQYTFGDGENMFLILGLFALFHASKEKSLTIESNLSLTK